MNKKKTPTQRLRDDNEALLKWVERLRAENTLLRERLAVRDQTTEICTSLVNLNRSLSKHLYRDLKLKGYKEPHLEGLTVFVN
jgi:hypothetical protein